MSPHDPPASRSPERPLVDRSALAGAGWASPRSAAGWACPRARAGWASFGLAVLFWPCGAEASGFATARFGGEHGNVLTTNPTALYYNPAGIGFSEGTDLYLDGNLAIRHATWDHAAAPSDPAPPAGAEDANAGRASLFNVFGAPALGATTRLGKLALGAGVFVPFGGRESWATNDKYANSPFPLAAAGVQRWHIIDGALTFVYGAIGAAYRVGPISFGVAGNVVYSAVSFSQAKNPTGQGEPDTAREGRDALDVSGIDASFGVGVMVDVVPDRLWFAASYQSQPGLGPQTLTGTLRVKSPSFNQNDDVTFTQSLPDVARAGIRWRPSEDNEFRVFGDFTRWSVMGTQCVALRGYACAVFPDGSDASGGTVANYRRYWKNTFGAHIGASHWAAPGVELFAGVGGETAAVPDSTLEPGLADADTLDGTAGMRLLLANGFYLAVSYTHIQYFDRNNSGASTLAGAQVPTKQQDGGGQYKQWIGLIDVNVEKTF